jgi:hypothetical protein
MAMLADVIDDADRSRREIVSLCQARFAAGRSNLSTIKARLPLIRTGSTGVD